MTETLFIDPGNPPPDLDEAAWDDREDAEAALDNIGETLSAPDPDAPHGRNPKTGKPYRFDGQTRQAMADRLRAGRRAARDAAQGSGRRPRATAKSGGASTATRSPRPPSGPNYRPAATTVLIVPATVLAVLGKVTGNRAFFADSAAITRATPDLADAVHAVALEDARAAALLENIGKVSPYGALFATAGALLIQCLANHRLVPPVPEMGILTVEQLIGPEPERKTGDASPAGDHLPG